MLFQKQKPKKYNRKDLEQILRCFQDKFCIYFKNPSVCHAKVSSYFIDRPGLEMTLECQDTAGLEKIARQLELSCRWEDLSLMRDHIICYDEGWHLFFNESLIHEILRIAGENPAGEDRLLKIMDRILGFLSSGA